MATKLIAVSEVVYVNPKEKDGKPQTATPGEKFTLEDDAAAESLIKLGAATEAVADKAPAKKAEDK